MRKKLLTIKDVLTTKSSAILPNWLKDYPDYKDQIKIIREALGMTQELLAQKVNRTPRSIRTIENGEAYPRITTLQRIAEALNSELKILIIPKNGLGEIEERKTGKEKRTVGEKKETDHITDSHRHYYEGSDFLIGVND